MAGTLVFLRALLTIIGQGSRSLVMVGVTPLTFTRVEVAYSMAGVPLLGAVVSFSVLLDVILRCMAVAACRPLAATRSGCLPWA